MNHDFHTITIKPSKKAIEEHGISTALNTEILLDGKIIEGLQGVQIDINGKDIIPIVKLTLVANVEVEDFKCIRSEKNLEIIGNGEI